MLAGFVGARACLPAALWAFAGKLSVGVCPPYLGALRGLAMSRSSFASRLARMSFVKSRRIGHLAKTVHLAKRRHTRRQIVRAKAQLLVWGRG